MKSLLEAELYGQQFNKAFENLMRDGTKQSFFTSLFKKKSPNIIPRKDYNQVQSFKKRLSSIIGNDEMPDRDKIIAMNMIMEDVNKYIEEATQGKNMYLARGWTRSLKQFSKDLQEAKSGYTTYADRIASSFSAVETRHKIFAAAFKLISFTKIGKFLHEKHTHKAEKATEAKEASLDLIKDGNGNNKELILGILNEATDNDFMGKINYFINDVDAVARKLKEEVIALRGTTAHLKDWKKHQYR